MEARNPATHPIPVGVEARRRVAESDRISNARWNAFYVLAGIAMTVAAFVAFTGCTAAQTKASEAAVNKALVELEGAMDWVQANPDKAHALVTKALAVDPSSKTLQAVAEKAHAAIDGGQLPLAHMAVVGGIALTQQATPSATPPGGQ